MPDKTDAFTRLTGRLVELTAQVERIEGALGRPLDDDFAEQAVEREDERF